MESCLKAIVGGREHKSVPRAEILTERIQHKISIVQAGITITE